MNDYFIDGIKFTRVTNNTKEGFYDIIYLDSSKLDKCIKLIKKLGVKCAYVYYSQFDSEKLDFIQKIDLSDITSLSIDINRKDLSPIEGLSNLEKLYLINSSSVILNFSKLKNLQFLSLDWSKKITGLENLTNLNILKVWKFSENNIEPLSGLVNLSKLEIIGSTITNLQGVGKLTNLERIDLESCKDLKNLNGLHENHQKLEHFSLWGASKLEDVDSLGFATNIKYIKIGRFKNIKSVKFLDKLPNIEGISILPNILDGDISPIKRVKVRNKQECN